MAIDANQGRTRRAILSGALGGLAALAASAVGRPLPARAASTAVMTETDNPTATTTSITATAGHALEAIASGAEAALLARQTNPFGGVAVFGATSVPESSAVFGNADSETGETYGCGGQVSSPDGMALMGWNVARGTAIAGYSGTTDTTVVPRADVAILGIAETGGSKARGVIGHVVSGQGVRGEAEDAAGYGVFSAGKLGTNRMLELREMGTPPTPPNNRIYLFARDLDGQTQLCARFANGTITVLAAM
jgi:hypothetical protein